MYVKCYIIISGDICLEDKSSCKCCKAFKILMGLKDIFIFEKVINNIKTIIIR